nr:hypothetical protein [uncultured Methanolobus sp.]
MSILDDITDILSNSIFFFTSFLIVRLLLNILAYIGKYNTVNSFDNDISQTISTLNSAIIDGLGLLLDTANPIPFTSINLSTGALEFDFIAGVIFLISMLSAFFVYSLKKD